MKNTEKNLRRTISAAACAALTLIPFGAFAQSGVTVKSYVYTADCGSDTGTNIDNIINDIKNNLGGIIADCSGNGSAGGNGGSSDSIFPNPDNGSTPDSKPDSGNKPDNGSTPDSKPDNGTTVPDGSGSVSAVSDFVRRVFELVNEIRVQNGLNPLTLNSELSSVARLKSEDMRDNKYFSHNSPTYGSPFEMLNRFGISYRTAGENIAMGQSTPEAVVNGWMNSEGHRANILNSSYTQIGVGYAANGHYWTQLFIG